MATTDNENRTALTPESVRARLDAALAELGLGADQVQSDSRLRENLELDSTEIVQISLELTRHLGVKVKLEDAGDPTVAEVCDLVLRTAEKR